jgi:glycosyltransferase involved in cell wall biosynthesis
VLVPVLGIDEMAAAIARCGPQMGQAGRRRIEAGFSVDAMARATERLWDERCLDEGGGPRVIVVVSRYSRRSTFIERELTAMRAAGVDMTIASLLPPEDAGGRIAPDACAGDGAVYLPFVPGPGGFGHVEDALRALLRHPVRCAAALGTIVLGQVSSPRVLLRSVAVFPKMLMIAGRAMRTRAAAIHAHWATISATAGMSAARIAGLPFSFSGHAWDLYFDTALLGRKLEAARFVAVCNAHSAAMLKERFPASAGKVRRLYHGLDLARFEFRPPAAAPAAAGPVRILAIGRLVPKKGFDALIAACGALQRDGTPVECVIRGEGGPEEARLREAIAREAAGLVRIDGYLPEPELIDEMRRYHLLAAPSIVQADGAMDGIPNVVIEAMAAGLPVVTTAVAGLPEIAEDGRTALVVPGNDPAALAAAIRRLATEPELGARLARAARETIELRFDLRNTAGELASYLGREETRTGNN